MHKLKLQAHYFNEIQSGRKIYEIRLNDEKRQLININDILEFSNLDDVNQTVCVKVIDLIKFDTFEQMANTLPLDFVGFANKSIQFTIDTYCKIYNQQSQNKFGVLAIKIGKI